MRRFLQFCHHHGVQPLPASAQTATYFATELSRSLAPSTIAVYLSAVASLHRRNGFRDPTHHNHILQLVLRGAKRAYSLRTTNPRKPITASMLANLLSAIKQSNTLCIQDQHMLSAAFTLAFFGFLRVSEFTAATPNHFDPRIHPSIADIQWAQDHFTFHLRHSKTDQFFKGQSVHFPRLASSICPFKAMSRYFAGCHLTKSPSRTPLFTFING